jgi:trans-aconitate 2-methyltransferase
VTEWNAEHYNHQSGLQQLMAAEQLASLRLEGTERILDVGCGDGRVTAAIAARVPGGSVVGVDQSHNMIAFASSHLSTAGHTNLRFEVADARSLPYRSEFDLVVSFNALHWVPEQALALRSIRTALKPAGRAVLRFVSAGERESIEEVIEEVRVSERWRTYFRDFKTPFVHFTPGAYEDLARVNGFNVASAEVSTAAWDFVTREAFAAYCRTTLVGWTQFLPDENKEAFITEVLDRYRSVAADNPGEANIFKFYQLAVVLTL